MSSPAPEVVQLLRSLLDVVDNLERALEASQAEVTSTESFAEGVRQIHRQLLDLLYRNDLRAFSSQGLAFDPDRHEAMGQVRTDDVPPRHVAREVRRGYLRADLLFRPAQVIVAAEPTAEQPSVSVSELARGFGQARVAQERSAPNRPGWLTQPPKSGRATLYCVGRAAAAQDLEEGQLKARNEALRELVLRLPELTEDERLGPALRELASALEERDDDDLWGPLTERLPEAERWVDDFYWEQVRGEIRGRSFDVAVLLCVPRERVATLLGPTELVTERWGGLELIDVGPLLEAFGGVGGALLVATHAGGVGTRAGLKPGDVITRVGLRPIEDAASCRRLMSLSGKQRRPFEVEFSRAFGPITMVRVDPGLRR